MGGVVVGEAKAEAGNGGGGSCGTRGDIRGRESGGSLQAGVTVVGGCGLHGCLWVDQPWAGVEGLRVSVRVGFHRNPIHSWCWQWWCGRKGRGRGLPLVHSSVEILWSVFPHLLWTIRAQKGFLWPYLHRDCLETRTRFVHSPKRRNSHQPSKIWPSLPVASKNRLALYFPYGMSASGSGACGAE